jgi:hypothetical protein
MLFYAVTTEKITSLLTKTAPLPQTGNGAIASIRVTHLTALQIRRLTSGLAQAVPTAIILKSLSLQYRRVYCASLKPGPVPNF